MAHFMMDDSDSETPNYSYQIHNQSCYGLLGVENESVDAVITDPPYGIGFRRTSGIRRCRMSRFGKIVFEY